MAPPLDLELLPDRLGHLGPLLGRYAVSDDTARGELVAGADDGRLRELADAADGRWDDINAFLDAYVSAPPGPHQDLALALDAFAQAAMEARLELDRRG